MSFQCPVCGYPALQEAPRDPQTGSGSYEICPSCGFQFGVDDDDGGWTYAAWRDRWTRAGMRWWSTSSEPPPGWDPARQLDALPPPPS